jgi:hypothetical protein
MKTQFTKQFLLDNCGCYPQEYVKKIIQKDEYTILEIVNSKIPLKDKFWFVINNCDLITREKQDLSINCAEIVLPIFEEKYPNDKRPREAIEAAKDYSEGKITREELIVKSDAADAARKNVGKDYFPAYAATAAYYTAYDASSETACYAATRNTAAKNKLHELLIKICTK